MSTITHIGVWTPSVNEPTEAALRMIRHVSDVKKFSEGYVAVLEQPVSLKVSSDLINAITKFLFVQNVGEYGDSNAHELPKFLN